MITQLATNALLCAASVVLTGLGFGLIYGTARFFHFAHGVVFTAGAYLLFSAKTWLGMPFWFSIPVAIASSTLLGILMERFIYRPLRRRASSALTLLLSSLGMYIAGQNLISLAYGDETRTVRSAIVREGISFLGANITPIQIVSVLIAAVLAGLLMVAMTRLKIGKSMRAVSNQPELARICGIDSDLVILWAFAIGSGLAAVGAIIAALDVDMRPTMGMSALMMAVIAVIVGGVRSIAGIALAALVLGIGRELGAWFIGAQWRDAIAFVILLAFLLFRPHGFFGKKVRKAAV